MKVTYKITRMDLVKWSVSALFRKPSIYIIILLGNCFVFFTTLSAPVGDMGVPPMQEAIYATIGLNIILVPMLLLISLVTPLFHKGQGVICEHTITLTDDALIEETAVNRAEYKWNGLHKLKSTGSLLLIYTHSNQAHLIPKSAFQDRREMKAFEDFIRNKMPKK